MSHEKTPSSDTTGSDNPFQEQLYQENYRYIRHIAESRLNDKSLADEVIDLTFITALHRIDDLQTDPKPRTWLFRTVLEIIDKCNEAPGGHHNE